MNNEHDFPLYYVYILLGIQFLLILLKYYYYLTLSGASNSKRFFRSFFRWYSSGAIDTLYDQPERQKFMRRNNIINIPFWILLIVLIIIGVNYIQSY